MFILQSAVKAATEGRVLVLEGIEKAERNVLPVLNNLLENREMQLDDGRFLMHSDRYDKLLKVKTYTAVNLMFPKLPQWFCSVIVKLLSCLFVVRNTVKKN